MQGHLFHLFQLLEASRQGQLRKTASAKDQHTPLYSIADYPVLYKPEEETFLPNQKLGEDMYFLLNCEFGWHCL